MILAVIQRENSVADVLSDEHLELCPEFLCIASETNVRFGHVTLVLTCR